MKIIDRTINPRAGIKTPEEEPLARIDRLIDLSKAKGSSSCKCKFDQQFRKNLVKSDLINDRILITQQFFKLIFDFIENETHPKSKSSISSLQEEEEEEFL